MSRLDEVILKSGAPLMGAAVYQYDPIYVELCSYLGVQVLWFEMEHAALDFSRISDLCRIASGLGLLTMIRIPNAEREYVLRAAECGPDILDLPMGNTPEILRSFVNHARYAPAGGRGFFGASRAVRYGAMGSIVEEQQRINRELCLVAQIETREAVDTTSALCQVEGIDGIFLGPGDLSASFEVTGQIGHPLVLGAMESVISTARSYGKRVALFSAPKDAGRWAALGADMIFCTSDVACLRSGAQAAVRDFQGSLAGAPAR